MDNPGHAVPLIPLTRINGQRLLLNLARVESFEEGDRTTRVILLRGNYYEVLELMDGITELLYDAGAIVYEVATDSERGEARG